jgi:hypothetical protein
LTTNPDMKLVFQRSILPLLSIAAVTAPLWMVSVSSASSIPEVSVNSLTGSSVVNLNDCSSTSSWKPNRCINNPCFRFRKKEEKSCDWVAAKPKRIKKLCGKKFVRKQCPISCEIEKCTTQTPSKSPSKPPFQPLQQSPYPRGKKGICYLLRDSGENGSYTENLPKIQALNPSWAYSWGPDPPGGVPTAVLQEGGIEILAKSTDWPSPQGIVFVPMLWGYYPSLIEDFADRMLDPNPRIVLGFNEPDSSLQSNLSVDYALEGWERLASKVTASTRSDSILVSPSCVHSTGRWCTEFIQRADQQGLRVDAIGFHWYGDANPQELFHKLTETYEAYGNRPIVITEFAVADWNAASVDNNKITPEQVLGFMESVLPWMEATEWILGYAWFSFEKISHAGWVSALVENYNDDTREVVLTPLGKYYAAFTKGSESDLVVTPSMNNIFNRIGS